MYSSHRQPSFGTGMTCLILKAIIKTIPSADINRIYVIAHSMGGHGIKVSPGRALDLPVNCRSAPARYFERLRIRVGTPRTTLAKKALKVVQGLRTCFKSRSNGLRPQGATPLKSFEVLDPKRVNRPLLTRHGASDQPYVKPQTELFTIPSGNRNRHRRRHRYRHHHSSRFRLIGEHGHATILLRSLHVFRQP